MPTWGDLIREIQQVAASGPLPGGASPFDVVRRKYLTALGQRTGRAVILYATKWTQPGPGLEPELLSLTAEDVQGFMEVVHGVGGTALDIVLHSPGGSAEATESLVAYLRSKFTDVRVFIPHAAMSAATMLACSANRIVMGRHSFLGPIDPQFIVQTDLGRASVAAHAIEEQFALAKEECRKQPGLLPAWVPILKQYGPALIVQCQLARQLSEDLVGDWLARYMLNGAPSAQQDAKRIAGHLADHSKFKSHSRFIDRAQAKALGLLIDDLEAQQPLQDAVLTVFHATTHTFNATPCVKIIENHLGKAFIKVAQQQVVMMQPAQPSPIPPPTQPPPGPPAAP
ncbi:MAG: serine protease [Deltaproteobacteria bacterium]|nr:MAG: serine protease [Deltaproteobacteria bacterium]